MTSPTLRAKRDRDSVRRDGGPRNSEMGVDKAGTLTRECRRDETACGQSNWRTTMSGRFSASPSRAPLRMPRTANRRSLFTFPHLEIHARAGWRPGRSVANCGKIRGKCGQIRGKGGQIRANCGTIRAKCAPLSEREREREREREGREGERGEGRSAGAPVGKGCRCTRPASPRPSARRGGTNLAAPKPLEQGSGRLAPLH